MVAADTVVTRDTVMTADTSITAHTLADADRATLEEMILFAFDRSAITDEAGAGLSAKLEVMKGDPAITLVIEGHADERGNSEYNTRLGQNRAEAVLKFFTGPDHGLDAGRFAVESRGEDDPLDPRPTPIGAFSRNRRVDFTVTAFTEYADTSIATTHTITETEVVTETTTVTEAVLKFFTGPDHGLDAGRFAVESRGEDDPLDPRPTPIGAFSRNRRVDFTVTAFTEYADTSIATTHTITETEVVTETTTVTETETVLTTRIIGKSDTVSTETRTVGTSTETVSEKTDTVGVEISAAGAEAGTVGGAASATVGRLGRQPAVGVLNRSRSRVWTGARPE
jgi:outer membrane protein OmpA-like peptidoglycan-associated protein